MSEIQGAVTRSLANDRERERERKAVDFAWPTPVANPMETPWRGHGITFIQDYTTTIIVTRSLPMSFSLCQIGLGAHARHQKHTHREQGRRSISHGCAYIHAIWWAFMWRTMTTFRGRLHTEELKFPRGALCCYFKHRSKILGPDDDIESFRNLETLSGQPTHSVTWNVPRPENF